MDRFSERASSAGANDIMMKDKFRETIAQAALISYLESDMGPMVLFRYWNSNRNCSNICC